MHIQEVVENAHIKVSPPYLHTCQHSEDVEETIKHTLLNCSPMVGMVVTISPNLSLYRMVVLPAASKPTVGQRDKAKSLYPF